MPLTPDERNKLAHLVRRASFGARPSEWDEYSDLGLAATTQKLLHPENTPDNLDELLQTIGGNFVDFDNIDGVRSWWIFRMAQTRRPLEEKMTLFWHNHFATANYKVRNPRWMAGQIEMFRQNALGSFRTLLQCVARDPAMLVWLDGDRNKLGAPNENFAREVMELFTMGVGSGYTEKDVQEAARSFTGYVYNASTRSFDFNPFLHDDGWKTVLGQGGNLYADDVIDIIVRQPATARFLARKLWKFFVGDEPPAAAIESVARSYFSSGFSVRAMLETIFTSQAFFDERARYALVKSPAEFVVGVIRTLDVPLLAIKNLPSVIESMGQDLLNPPNVAGWPGGKNWINTRTLLARVNFSSQVTSEMNRRGQLMGRVRDDLLEPAAPLNSPTEIVNAIWDALMPGRAMDDRERTALLAYVKGDGSSAKINLPAKLPGLLSLIMGAPEYQMA
jgi:uncharacterized protein (DUF1800 family)